MALLPSATEGSGSPLKGFSDKRAAFFALELIENRCASRAANFIRANFGPGVTSDLDVSTGRRLLGDGPLVKALAKQVKVAGNEKVCSIVAVLVDEACQDAPDDRGVASVAPWLISFSCTSANP